MKVGQITYCGENYGSVLQCYATQTELKKRDLDCVLITRSETGMGRVLQSLEFRLNRVWKFLRYPKYRGVFRECLQTLQPRTSTDGLQEDAVTAINIFVQNNICRERHSWHRMKKLARSQEYGFFLSGSDQIWSANWFITNRIWFLRFSPREKRVAWMPSFGGRELAEYNRPAYAKYISQYAHLSVREEAGKEIIEELLNISVPALADPVFLLTADQWRDIALGQPRQKPYIMMFFIDQPSAVAMKQASLLQEKTDCEILYFAYKHHNEKGVFTTGGPEQFLYLIDRAQAVLTDSFHACAFSAILDTPFYAFSRSGSSGAKQMSRVKNLLDTLTMPERYVDTEDACSSEISAMPQQVYKAVDEMRNRILHYLDAVLQDYQGKEK